MSKKSSITYYDPYNVWPIISEDFLSHLPLRNLHWKSPNRPLRSIQSLEVEMVQHHLSSEEQPHQMPISLLERPYLNMMLVQCDDNETYRSSVRKTIREWYNSAVNKRNQEWMILHVIPKSASAPGRPSSRFTMKGSVYDKIRADFNSSKKDRCAQLRSCDSESEELEMWQDILGKIKEGVLTSFDSRVQQYEEDIRKMDSQRTLPGWNYCTFFILKEGLAQSFEHMFLLEDSLIQYDELEASFFQLLRDKQLTWFTRTGGTSPGDDSANILDLSHKDYRTLILANNISLFDFRVYLFARQCHLLTAMRKYAEICSRARDYITTLALTLRSDRERAGISFIESWMFSAAMTVVEATRKGQRSVALAAATGDLLVIARTQLDKLGHYFKLIPESVPFEGTFAEVELDDGTVVLEDDFKTTNDLLKEVIADEKKFCDLYRDITSQALENFKFSHRIGSADAMTADLASLYYYQKDFTKAASLLKDLSIASTEHGWNMIECALMKMYAQCLRETGDIDGQTNILLRLLLHRHEFTPKEGIQYIDTLEQNLSQITKPIELPLKDYFNIQISARAQHYENKDGFQIKVLLTSNLPRSITFSLISLKVISISGRELYFTTPNPTISPGHNEIWTHTSLTAPGQYIFESISVEWDRVKWKQEFVEMGRKQGLGLFPHGEALQVSARLDDVVYLDRSKKVVVCVETGWNEVSGGTVVVKSESGVKFDLDKALGRTSSDEELEISTSKGIISLPSAGAHSSIQLVIPFVPGQDQTNLNLNIEVNYSTTEGEYIYLHTCTIPISLALSVSVTDIFRAKSLLSVFSVHCAMQPLRILKVQLTSNDAFTVWTPSPTDRDLIIIQDKPAKFTYIISKAGISHEITSTVKEGHPLMFTVQYRIIEKEIETILKDGLRKIIREKGQERLAFRLFDTLRLLVDRMDLEMYRIFGMIAIQKGKEFEEAFPDVMKEDQVIVQDIASAFFTMFKEYNVSKGELDKVPRETLYIPADVPSMDVVHTVNLVLKPGEEKHAVGMPIQAELSIFSSYNWHLSGPVPPNEIDCFYDLDFDPDTWLVSGCRRAQFTAQDGSTSTFNLKLIPLRHGILRTPKVEIEVLTPKITSEVEDASIPDAVIYPTKFTAVYKVDVPEMSNPQ